MDVFKQQYELVRSTRKFLLKFCGSIPREKLVKEIPEFNYSCMSMLLVHIANCYVFWIANFSLKKEAEYYKDEHPYSIDEISEMFIKADEYVYEFIDKFLITPDINVTGYNPWLKKVMPCSPLSIFSHVITHEFHHKGQMMTMSRLLGYTPPDTDLIRFE